MTQAPDTRALAVLRNIQWGGRAAAYEACPSCDGRRILGHSPTCELAATIAALEEVQGQAAPQAGVGDLRWVEKHTGDYTWGGWLVSTFKTPDGHVRHVVAHPVDRGHVLHIYGPANIRQAGRPDHIGGVNKMVDPAAIRRAALEDAAKAADVAAAHWRGKSREVHDCEAGQEWACLQIAEYLRSLAAQDRPADGGGA